MLALVQQQDGTIWCQVHDCDAYECECAFTVSNYQVVMGDKVLARCSDMWTATNYADAIKPQYIDGYPRRAKVTGRCPEHGEVDYSDGFCYDCKEDYESMAYDSIE